MTDMCPDIPGGISCLRNAVSTGLLLILLYSPGRAQDIVFRGDPEPIGARSAALGGSLASDFRDIEGLYNNVASLRALTFPGVTANHRHEWDLGIFSEVVALRAYSTDFHSFGLGVRMTDAGSYGPQRLLKFTQYAVDIGYAFNILSDLSIGVLAGAREGKASGQTMSGYSFSFGLLYAPTPSVSYAIVVRDLGKSLEYAYSSVTGATTVGRREVRPTTVEMGSTLLFPSKGRNPFLQLSVAVERDYILRELRYKGGIELIPWPFLAARVGYINATVAQATGGLGVTIGNFRFDYGIMPRRQTSRYDEFSVKVFF